MKKIFIIVMLVLSVGISKSQNVTPEGDEHSQKNIEALKVAFISKELELTPEEAQKFWPVYNQYSNEIKTTRKENEDVLERDEKVLNIRKRYKEQFTKILGPQRINTMFSAENNFHKVLIKAWHRQNQMQDRPNREMMQRPR